MTRESPVVSAPPQIVDIKDTDSILAYLQELTMDHRSKAATLLQAGMNREFNGPAASLFAKQALSLTGGNVCVYARVDDDEIWPEKKQTLRHLSLADRIDNLHAVSRGSIMDAVPYLSHMENELHKNGIELDFLKQPMCNSYMEMKWSVLPPDASMELPAETTHIINPVNCPPLQQRMAIAANDALSGDFPESLQAIGLPCHDHLNEKDETKSLLFIRTARRLLGKKRYEQLCIGEGVPGKLYKAVQDWKIRRGERLHKHL